MTGVQNRRDNIHTLQARESTAPELNLTFMFNPIPQDLLLAAEDQEIRDLYCAFFIVVDDLAPWCEHVFPDAQELLVAPIALLMQRQETLLSTSSPGDQADT